MTGLTRTLTVSAMALLMIAGSASSASELIRLECSQKRFPGQITKVELDLQSKKYSDNHFSNGELLWSIQRDIAEITQTKVITTGKDFSKAFKREAVGVIVIDRYDLTVVHKYMFADGTEQVDPPWYCKKLERQF